MRKINSNKLPNEPAKSSLQPKTQTQLTVPTTVVVDAEFLRQCLKENLKAELFHICFSANAVIACRLFPDEKSMIVRYCHLYRPKMTTASIGDGANDVPMIKAAQIGIGVAGKEGFYSCNNADVSLPEFKFLRRLILVHGRLNHYRNSELAYYSIYKNSILVYCNLLYQYFCSFTGLIIVDSFLLMMFNTLITAVGIFIFAISEKDILDRDVLNDPYVFRNFTQKKDNNILQIVKQQIYAFYSAIIVFFFTMLWHGNGVNNIYGIQQDLYFFQCLIMFQISIIGITKVYLTTKMWNLVTFIGLIISIILIYGTILIGNYITLFGQGLIGFIQMFYQTISPSIHTIYTTVLSLLPFIIEHHVIGTIQKIPEYILMKQKSHYKFVREYDTIQYTLHKNKDSE